MTRFRAIALVLATVLVLPVAISQAQTKSLTWSFNLGMGCLDPAFQTGWPDSLVMTNVYEGLVRATAGTIADIEPWLAESWTISNDGLEYTFVIREGAEWHDGYGPVTAHDVVYSWNRMRDPATGARGANQFDPIDTFEAVDDRTFLLTLHEPSAPFLTTLAHTVAFLVVNEQAIADSGDDYCVTPVGSGPFRIVSAERQGTIVMEANRAYNAGVPALDRVELRHIPEESVAGLALRSGEIDMAIIRDADVLTTLLGAPGLTNNVDPNFSAGLLALWLNTSRPPLDDVRVRQALTYALDRAAIVPVVTDGLLDRVAHSILPPSVFGHDESFPRYEHDPERARQLLAEAGLEGGFEVEAIAINTGFNSNVLTIVQQMWANVGVTLNIELADIATTRARQGSGDYDINVSNPSRAEPDQFLDYFRAGNEPPGPNWMYYTGSDELQALIERQVVTLDADERRAILEEIQRIVAADAPLIPLWNPINATVYREGITGVAPNIPSVVLPFYQMDIE